MRTVDVLVVGGGLAGLVAAAFAAKGGAGVRLLEASPEFGGRARTRTVAGYHLNQGAHAFYCGGFLDTALKDLGVAAVAGKTPALASGFLVDGDTLHQAPFRAAGLAGTTLLSEAEKGELARLFRRLRDPSTQTAPGTVDDALGALSPSPKVRAVLAAMIRLTSLVHAPTTADGPALLDQLRGGLTRNALYLDGGWGTLVQGLRSACAALGADLRTSRRVERIEPGPPWRATLADGTAMTAGAVILAVPPSQAAALHPAIGALPSVVDATPARVACLDLGLASLPRPDVLFALGVDRPLYFSVHSAAARLAPAGGALVHLVRYLEPGETPARGHLAELEAFMDLLQPGWRGHERARQVLPAMPAISAIPLAAHGGLNARPPVAVPNAEGLFLAGDWIGPAGLLADAAAASARAAGEGAAAFARALTASRGRRQRG